MSIYQLTNSTTIIRLADMASIPDDPRNCDYQVYLAWLAEGNIPDPVPVPPIPPLPPIEQRQATKWQEIKDYRDMLTQTGGYKVDTKWYHSDTFSRTQQMGMVMMGANMPEGIMWKTMDGSFIEMTPLLALRIFNAAALSDQAMFTAAETHKTTMMTLEHPEDYDITKNWPEVFKE